MPIHITAYPIREKRMTTQKTDLQQAVEQTNPQELVENLTDKSASLQPQALEKQQETPFIDDTLRTDK